MNLTKKMRKGIAVAGIGLASILNNGCETSTDTALFGGLLGAMGASPVATSNQSRAFSALSQGAYVASQNQARENSATRVNVNVNNGGQDQGNQLVQIYGCKWNDLNQNKKIDGGELGERKKHFSKNEDFTLIVDIYNYPPTAIKEIVRDKNGKIDFQYQTNVEGKSSRAGIKYLKEEIFPGEYTFEVYFDNEFLYSWPFTITE